MEPSDYSILTVTQKSSGCIDLCYNDRLQTFSLCVDALEFAAKKLDPIWPGGRGMNYTKINVLLFCVVGPAIFATSVGLNIVLAIKLARLGR